MDYAKKLAARHLQSSMVLNKEARSSKGTASELVRAYQEGAATPDASAAGRKLQEYRKKMDMYLRHLTQGGGSPGDYLLWIAALTVDIAYESGRLR